MLRANDSTSVFNTASARLCPKRLHRGGGNAALQHEKRHGEGTQVGSGRFPTENGILTRTVALISNLRSGVSLGDSSSSSLSTFPRGGALTTVYGPTPKHVLLVEPRVRPCPHPQTSQAPCSSPSELRRAVRLLASASVSAWPQPCFPAPPVRRLPRLHRGVWPGRPSPDPSPPPPRPPPLPRCGAVGRR